MNRGMIDVPSPYSVPDTLSRLESILKEKGLTILARVDHSGEAEKAGAPDSSHSVADLWKSERRYSTDGCDT